LCSRVQFLDGFHDVGAFDQSEWFDEFEALMPTTTLMTSSSRDFIKSPPPYAAVICEVMPASTANIKR
jgi:hypothetical protein